MRRNLNEQIERISELSHIKNINNSISENVSDKSGIIDILNQLKGIVNTGFKAPSGYSNTVKKIQQLLLFLGYKLPKNGADGRYGPETAQALSNFSSGKILQENKIIVEQHFGVFSKIKSLFDALKSYREKGIYVTKSYSPIVKIIQHILIFLGYKLPKNGADGRYGPETAQALKSLTGVNFLNESSSALRSTLSDLGYNEKGTEISSGGEIDSELASIVDQILRYYKKLMPDVNVTVTSGNDKYHQTLSYNSLHKRGLAIDFTLNPFNDKNLKTFLSVAQLFKGKYPLLGVRDEYTYPSDKSTGGHVHLQLNKKDNNNENSPNNEKYFISPLVIDKLLTKLNVEKSLIIEPETLNNLISKAQKKADNMTNNNINNNQSDFTELDLNNPEDVKKYALISDEFIRKRKSNLLNITGNMIASGALKAFQKHGKYIPPELSLSQLVLEGGIGNDNPQSKPVRTRNPYNVGNVDTGKSTSFKTVQDGIDAYFDLIARKYVSDKSVNDLFNNYVSNEGNRYATDRNYENLLQSISKGVNKISRELTV